MDTLVALNGDESRAVDVDGEQLVLGLLGPRPDPFLHNVGEAAPPFRVIDVDGPPIKLEISLFAVAVGDDAVDEATAVPQQVQCLQRVLLHAEVQMAVGDEHLDGGDTRPAWTHFF